MKDNDEYPMWAAVSIVCGSPLLMVSALALIAFLIRT